MSDPMSTKTGVAILGILGIAATPLAGDWLMVAMGAVAGAILDLSRAAQPEELRGWLAAPKRFLANVIAGLIFARFAVAIAITDPEAAEYALAAVAAVMAYGWRHILPAAVDRISKREQKGPSA